MFSTSHCRYTETRPHHDTVITSPIPSRITVDKTKLLIGISETLISTAIAGVIFSLFSCQPLIIVGTTGPVLLFDEALFSVRHYIRWLAKRV